MPRGRGYGRSRFKRRPRRRSFGRRRNFSRRRRSGGARPMRIGYRM